MLFFSIQTCNSLYEETEEADDRGEPYAPWTEDVGIEGGFRGALTRHQAETCDDEQQANDDEGVRVIYNVQYTMYNLRVLLQFSFLHI